MNNVLRLASFAVVCSLLTAPAFAGGDGGKNDNPTLTIRNETGVELYVKVVKEGEVEEFIDEVIQRIVDGDASSFSEAFNELQGLVINFDAESEPIELDAHQDYTILYASTDPVDLVPLLPGQVNEARTAILNLTHERSVEIEDEDVRVELNTPLVQ